MERPGAAERDEREVARIVTAFHRDDAESTEHLGVHDLDRVLRIDARERLLRSSAVQSEPARQRRRQTAEQEVGVRDGRSRAAVSVAGRAGHRAGALRADAQRAAGIAPDDRAAAGADRVDVDHREPDREAADGPLGRPLRAAADDERHVR